MLLSHPRVPERSTGTVATTRRSLVHASEKLQELRATVADVLRPLPGGLWQLGVVRVVLKVSRS